MYSTGSATGVVDLITKLEAFLSANGWTTDSFATEGSGKRYHAHSGSVFLNMRGYNNETPDASIFNSSGSVYGLAFNLSTAGTGGSAWFDKTGAPATATPAYMTSGIVGLTGAIPSYHFFTDGVTMMVVVEYTAGFYQFLGCGTLTKYGAYTGGTYFFGSRTGVENTVWASNAFSPGIGFFSKYAVATLSPSFVSLSVDGETSWHWSDGYPGGRDSTKRYIGDNFARYETTLAIQPNSLNDLAVMMPVVVRVDRDSTHGTHFSPIGELPHAYQLRISNLTPGQQITLGSDDYRVFPFWHKDTSSSLPSVFGSPHSSYYGFAVKE